MYALDMQTGNIKWQFNAKSIIRSTPAFHGGKLFFGDCNQHVYSINAADGKLDWTPPSGEWKIVRLGYSLTGKQNHPVNSPSMGLVEFWIR